MTDAMFYAFVPFQSYTCKRAQDFDVYFNICISVIGNLSLGASTSPKSYISEFWYIFQITNTMNYFK